MATFEGSSLAQCAESVPKSGDPQKVRMVMMTAVPWPPLPNKLLSRTKTILKSRLRRYLGCAKQAVP
jgi:hypothetical protein